MNKERRFVLVLIVAFIIAILVTYEIVHKDRLAAQKATVQTEHTLANIAWNKHMIDSCSRLLKTGDLVLRTGVEVTSYILQQMNLQNKTYSHSGLVIIEKGVPYIYHSIGGEENPDAVLRRDRVEVFFAPANNFGFAIARYDMPDSTIQNLAKTVQRFYKEKRKFDLDFDLATDDRLYCAEFVYKAVIQATNDSAYLPISSAFGHQYVGVDNLFVNKHAHMVCEVKFK